MIEKYLNKKRQRAVEDKDNDIKISHVKITNNIMKLVAESTCDLSEGVTNIRNKASNITDRKSVV